MLASEVDQERFGNSEFPDSKKIEAGTRLEGNKAVIQITPFVSKKGFDGVSLKLRDNTLAYTTASQPVGYILSEKLNLKGLIEKSNGKGISLFFKSVQSDKGNSMLMCSIYP